MSKLFTVPTEAIISRRLVQAYLITAGSAEAADEAARDFARAIFCETGTGCGICQGCRKFDSGNHMDYLEISSDGAINKDAIADLPFFLSVRPMEGGYRVIYIKNAHNMNTTVQNRLLKSFEDPPPNTVFILATDTPTKLLPTVASRCLKINLTPPAARSSEESEKFKIALAYTGGFAEQAEALLSDAEFFAARDAALSVAKKLLTGKVPIFTLAQELLQHGKKISDCLFTLSACFMDAAAWQIAKTEPQFTPDMKEAFAETKLSAVQLSKISETTLQYAEKQAANPGVPDRLITETMFFDIMDIIKQTR